jgi:hypothetical protein
MTLELTGASRPSGLTVSGRRFSGDGGATMATVRTRHPGDAAREIAERIGKAVDGLEARIAPRVLPVRLPQLEQASPD